jgi:hypothetical protein
MENLIVISIFVLLLLLVVFVFKCENKAVKNKQKYLVWLDQRISELQKEYDSIIVYDDTPEFQIKLSKGGKLKAYKEIRDYINSH